MERVIAVAVVVAIAVMVAAVVGRRRPEAPTQSTFSAPAQLDRDDFDQPAVPWLVAVFTSATCESCALVKEKAAVLASADVVVQEIEVSARKDLHDRYGVDAVPMIVLADAEGVVQASFIGPPSATDLWAAVAEARAARNAPEPDPTGPGGHRLLPSPLSEPGPSLAPAPDAARQNLDPHQDQIPPGPTG